MVLTSEQQRANNAAIVFTGAALASLLPVAAHQLGFLEHLPDPPGPFFASGVITESKAAHPFGVPDGILGLASYTATFALLLAIRRTRLVQPLLEAKLKLDAAAAAANTVRQAVTFRRVCSWCTMTAIATAAVVHFGRKSLP